METGNQLPTNPAGPDELLAQKNQERLARSAAVVLVSGGFDPLHVGHVRMIEHAARYGNVHIALNSDEWLYRKKGYFFMPWEERAEILTSLLCVFRVLRVDDEDGTVCEALRSLKPSYFVNGGDRISPNRAEARICKRQGIEQIFDAGGGKVQSSSALISSLWQKLNG